MIEQRTGFVAFRTAILEAVLNFPAIAKRAWVWLLIYAAVIAIQEYRFYTDDHYTGGGLIGEIVLFCALVAVLAIKTHRLILTPQSSKENPPPRIHFQYGFGWFVLGILSFLPVILIISPFVYFAFTQIHYDPLELLYDSMPFALFAFGGIGFVIMYLFYRLGMGLPHIAIVGKDMAFSESWRKTRSISKLIATSSLWACLGWVLISIPLFAGPLTYLDFDVFGPMHVLATLYTILFDIVCVTVGAAMFSVLYRAAEIQA